jgi:cellulose synthase/poly-beta-1,6-N-acetylglucosamine synthase-like glycosyltransferase
VRWTNGGISILPLHYFVGEEIQIKAASVIRPNQLVRTIFPNFHAIILYYIMSSVQKR